MTVFILGAIAFVMKRIVIIICLLTSVSSWADDLEGLAEQFAKDLGSPTFNISQFCSRFWLREQLETCEKSFPWDYVRGLKPSFAKPIRTPKSNLSFIAIKLPVGSLLFTASYDSRWRVSLDLKKVWDVYSDSWRKNIGQFETRYAEPVETGVSEEIERRIIFFHNEIARTIKVPVKLNIPFYFLNSQQLAANLGLEYPKFISGGARDGFVLIVGNPSIGMWSTFLHELVHTYSAFPGTLWKGKGPYPNAAFSEGLATVFQMRKIWEDDLPPELISQFLCKDIQIAESLLDQDVFQILDDTFFRSFDSKGYHPAYLVGAAIVKHFLESMSASEFAALWNQIGNATSLSKRKSILLSKKSESELHSALGDYMRSLRTQINDVARNDCR